MPDAVEPSGLVMLNVTVAPAIMVAPAVTMAVLETMERVWNVDPLSVRATEMGGGALSTEQLAGPMTDCAPLAAIAATA